MPSTHDGAGAAGLVKLADEATAAGDLNGAVLHLAGAVRGYTAAGDNRQAAMICARLGTLFVEWLGNRSAGLPWYRRAIRLVENEPPCVEQGWVAVGALGCEVDDPAVLLERAELALDRARMFGDVDLETKALADGGLALVQAGRVAEGMAMVDEAMALACGGGTDDPVVAGRSMCSFLTACYVTADFERVEKWSRTFRQRGLVGPAPGAPAILRAHCDSVQGTLLCHLGRWGEAERVLLNAHDDIEAAMPAFNWHPPIALAELRILQGRLAEAEALLLGRDDHMLALVPTARLHLARGDQELARATARRGLRVLGDDRVRAAALLGVLVEAELGRGDLDRAAEASTELDTRTAGVGLPALDAEAARMRARVRAAQGDGPGAVSALQEGLDRLAGVELPLLKASLHLDLARMLESEGDRPAAVVEARAASALLSRLDVLLTAADAALMDRLGVALASRPVAAGCRVAILRQDGPWWTVGCGEASVRLRDTKGLRYLAELVARPGSERHALDLVDVVEGVPSAGTGVDRRLLGDAGELLDGRAREAYRHRIAELREEVQDALAVEDDERAVKAQSELDALVSELARAFGVGGRARKASSAAEKARLNVTRALRAAVANVAGALPEAGAVLDRRVRTGLYCAYVPHADDDVVWSVQS